MKKFTSLLLLLLTMFVGGVNHVWAQAIPVPSEGENVYEYYVQNAGTNNGYYLSTAQGSTDQVQFSNNATRLKVKIVALTGDDAGKYQMFATNGPISGKTLIGCTGNSEGAKVQYGSSSENLLFKWYISSENVDDNVKGYCIAYSICPENDAKNATSGKSWNFYENPDKNNLALYGHTDQGSKWNFIPANAAAVNKLIEQIQSVGAPNPFSVSVSEAVKKLKGKSDMLAAGLTKRSNSSIDINIPTGYYRMRNADVDGDHKTFSAYLFSDYSKKFAGENVWNTLANVPVEADAYNNNYIWHLTKAEGSNEVAILSGQGVGVHNGTEYKTIHTGLSDYWSSNMVYFTEGLHITNQAQFTVKNSANNDAAATQTNPFKMTSWNHSDSKGSAYYLEPVDLTKYDIYTVTFVNAGEGAKVEYNGMVALNGGFFAVTKGTTISESDLTPTTGKTNNVVTINDHAITIDCSVQVSYIYQIDGKTTTKTLKQTEGSAANAPALPFITFTQPEGTIAPDKNQFTVVCQTALPFIVSENSVNATWYAINVRGLSANNVLTVSDEGNFALTELGTVSPDAIQDKYLWRVEGNYVDGYKFYNKATGKALVATDPVTVGTEGTALKLTTDESKIAKDAFCLYAREGNCLNEQKGQIKTWTGFDDGSAFRVVRPYAYALNYAAQYTQYPENALNSLSAYSTEKYEALSKAVDAVKADPSAENVANLYTTNAEISNIAGNIPTDQTIEVGKYYRLYSIPEAKYLTVYRDGKSNSNLMHNEATTAKSPASVFQFVESGTEGQYNIKVEGLTLGKVTMSQNVQLVDAEANKGKFEVAHEGAYFTFLDKTNSASQYAYLHVNGGNCVGWEASAAKTQWVVVPATDIEVALTKVNDNAYATAYLPFPVSAVSGAKAYVGKLNAERTTVTLEEAAGIAANEGVVLMGAADATKATLTIGGTAEKVTGNAFAGTNTEIAFSDAISRDNYLVFGRKSGETTSIGFFKPSEKVTKIPANRAYIAANTSTNGTSSVLVNFGTVEGLGSIVTETSEDANSPIYDLSGRRVMHTVKGGLYIRNGKKFLVK